MSPQIRTENLAWWPKNLIIKKKKKKWWPTEQSNGHDQLCYVHDPLDLPEMDRVVYLNTKKVLDHSRT